MFSCSAVRQCNQSKYKNRLKYKSNRFCIFSVELTAEWLTQVVMLWLWVENALYSIRI